MRDIKFRAKATQNHDTNTDSIEMGQWVYGYYYFCRQRMSGVIVTTMQAESGGVGSGLVQVEILVDEKTVGQYTGLKDKNGKESYWNDIARTREGISKIIDWNGNTWLEGIDWEGLILLSDRNAEFEIIGNIHQNS